MRIGRFSYNIKVEKKPNMDMLKKDVRNFIKKELPNHKDAEFEIVLSKLHCRDLYSMVYYDLLKKEFYSGLEKIGQKYGIRYLSFPSYYHHK